MGYIRNRNQLLFIIRTDRSEKFSCQMWGKERVRGRYAVKICIRQTAG